MAEREPGTEGLQAAGGPVLPEPIVHKTWIRSSRDDVFNALATAAGFDAWFTRGTALEERPGGELRFVWRDWGADRENAESAGIVREHRRPELFVFQWWLDHPTTVTLTFESKENGTLVRVHENGYANTREGLERCLDCATGWGEALTLVKFYLEHGVTYR